MPRGIKMIIIIIAVSILLSSATFILLAKYYPSLNRKLFGGEYHISFDDIQFWLRKVPQRNYYRVCAKYLKDTEKIDNPEFGHDISFTDRENRWGSDILFNPENNKIYGAGWSGLPGDSTVVQIEPEQWKRVFYYLCEGKIEKGIFKFLFPEGTKFTFHPLGLLEITSAPRYYIKIYFPGSLKKLNKEELEMSSMREIVEDVTRVKK